jgi:hypothetical protein
MKRDTPEWIQTRGIVKSVEPVRAWLPVLLSPESKDERVGAAFGRREPNCKFNVDANSGHAFGILLAAVGALRPCGAPAPVN